MKCFYIFPYRSSLVIFSHPDSGNRIQTCETFIYSFSSAGRLVSLVHSLLTCGRINASRNGTWFCKCPNVSLKSVSLLYTSKCSTWSWSGVVLRNVTAQSARCRPDERVWISGFRWNWSVLSAAQTAGSVWVCIRWALMNPKSPHGSLL